MTPQPPKIFPQIPKKPEKSALKIFAKTTAHLDSLQDKLAKNYMSVSTQKTNTIFPQNQILQPQLKWQK